MPSSWKIELSTVGCLVTLAALAYFGGSTSAFWYLGPYLVVNAWLVGYTWLQHTHPDVPHYGSDDFSRLRGALCTIDRPYPWLVDHLHHHIGTTHVAHHIDYKVPHYRAQAFTRALRPVLGEHYLFDATPISKALWTIARECHYVEGVEGTQYYKRVGAAKTKDVAAKTKDMAAKTNDVAAEINDMAAKTKDVAAETNDVAA